MPSCPSCFTGTPLWQLYDITENNPEFCLYDSVVSEYTDIAGFPVMYYRANSRLDRLFGEDANQDYHAPVKTKLIYEPSEEPNIIDGLGIRSDETLQYASLPKTIFTRDVALGDTTIQPMAGDVIKTLWNNRNYEIVDLGAEQNIFMAKKLIWEFILRPYRFAEQSAMAESIHRSKVEYKTIYILPPPDNGYADVTMPDGTVISMVDITTLGIDASQVRCGYRYSKDFDGGITLFEEVLTPDDELDPHPEYNNTGIIIENKLVEALGDNEFIEVESDTIDDYSDVDNLMLSTARYTPMLYGSSVNTVLSQLDLNEFTRKGVLNNQTQELAFTPSGKYIYVVMPYKFGDVQIMMGDLIVGFDHTVRDLIIDDVLTKVNVYRSQFIQNSASLTISVRNFKR